MGVAILTNLEYNKNIFMIFLRWEDNGMNLQMSVAQMVAVVLLVW
jgi:hypothetical protein